MNAANAMVELAGDAENARKRAKVQAPEESAAANSGRVDTKEGGPVSIEVLAGPDHITDAILNDIVPDVPPEHEAHTKVIFTASKGGVWSTYVNRPSGRFRVQTTVNAVGSRNAAGRVGRLAYVYMQEDGREKDEFIAFRKELYDKIASATGHISKQNWPSEAVVEKARAEYAACDGPWLGYGRSGVAAPAAAAGSAVAKPARERKKPASKAPPADSVSLQGRATDRKNHRLNGTYAQMQKKFEGNLAFEKLGSDTDGGSDLYIFYAATKSRWKISPILGDPKGGLAQCKTSTSSSPADVGDSPWLFYDGKDEGYRGDALVKCTRHGGGATANAKSAGASAEAAPSPPVPSLPLSSEPPTAEPAAFRDAREISKPDGGSASSSSSSSNMNEVKHSRGLACAKMLARSGLRCHCCFLYTKDCPKRT